MACACEAGVGWSQFQGLDLWESTVCASSLLWTEGRGEEGLVPPTGWEL